MAGGLISLGPDLVSMGRQGARLIDKIIRGGAPMDLPVESSRLIRDEHQFTAKALGLEMPAMLLARADEVIE